LEHFVLPAGSDYPRLLLVGSEPPWRDLVVEIAHQIGAQLDIVADVGTALARMLHPEDAYDHVLAIGPLRSREVDALAGMLDEVTRHTGSLILLGAGCNGVNTTRCVHQLDAETLRQALSATIAPVNGSPLSAAELTAALHGGGLRMRFQPIVRRSDLQPIGIEALARVHTRHRGIMHPKDFIPATIASGRERILTSIAAARTFLEISGLLCGPDLFVTMNLPLVSVMHMAALRRGVELCAMAGIEPSRVMVEVLESRAAPDMALLGAALSAWRNEGFKMAIDDAGPELPHWRQLIELPFDAVKLDGILVSDPSSQGLLENIVTEAKARGRFIIAEGIENEACLERVRPLEVDALQGFLFARPLPAMALPIWLKQWAESKHVLPHAELAA
jgi:EAL domain-containing protein (putative c-di-GMP-specific phosphodiesterase class I)